MRLQSRLGFLALSASVVVFVGAGIFFGNVLAREANVYSYLRLFNDALHLIENNYVEAVDSERLLRGAYQGLFETLDPQSEYLSPQEYADLVAGGPPPAGGAGLHLYRRRGHLMVLSVRKDGPAAQAEIRPGEQILRIADRPTRALSLFGAERRLRGLPGTEILLTVLGSHGGGSRDILITLDETPAAIAFEEPEPGTAWLRLRDLSADAATRVEPMLRQFRDSGGERLIVDLRQNNTRALGPALDMARLFLEQGPILMVEERDGIPTPMEEQTGAPLWDRPMVVLVGPGTAAAGEALAAALQGRHRSLLLGQKTFGNGTRSELFPLPNGAAVQLSTGRLVRVDGDGWNGTGLLPDVVLEPEIGEDEILRRASELLSAAVNGREAA